MGFGEHKFWQRCVLFSLIEVKAMPAFTSKKKRELVVDSGESMHMMSKKELSSEKMDTVRSFTLHIH